jgi:hypothetical protein
MNKTKIAALILALSAIPLSIDATLLHLPGIPSQVAMYWPLVLAVASVLHKIASTFQDKPE